MMSERDKPLHTGSEVLKWHLLCCTDTTASKGAAVSACMLKEPEIHELLATHPNQHWSSAKWFRKTTELGHVENGS